MKAMIFAAGMGSRLRPLTDHTPKALIPVAGVPMIERVIHRLQAAGVDDITVNIHHLGSQLIDYLHQHPHPGLTIHVSDERDQLLDTGGGLLHALPHIDGREPILVHNADIITDVDLAALYRHHVQSRADATLLVAKRNTTRYLLMDRRDLRLRGWTNTKTGELRPEGFRRDLYDVEQWAFGGIHIVNPQLIHRMQADGLSASFPLIPYYLSVCHDAHIYGNALPGTWFDAGRADTLAQAEQWVRDIER